ncbi:hypothetical protein [Streptomyces yunnanensis]|uniref:hypothetical protein n=1 Tax=Streptomyces yunnanensis TaxID=156453 RepID=UPI003D9C1038
MDRVAERSGLGSPDSLRHHLLRRVRLTPTAYRRQYRPPQDAGTGRAPLTVPLSS